jgi:hypothetical protein
MTMAVKDRNYGDKMGKEEHFGCKTTHSVEEVAKTFRSTLDGEEGRGSRLLRELTYEPLENSGDPFAQFNDKPDFAVVARWRNKRAFAGQSDFLGAIQLYVADRGDHRDVRLIRIAPMGGRRQFDDLCQKVIRSLA